MVFIAMRLAELTLGWPVDSEVQDWALGLSDEYLLDNNYHHLFLEVSGTIPGSTSSLNSAELYSTLFSPRFSCYSGLVLVGS